MFQPPQPLVDPPGAKLRFAVGDPAGMRSSTWTVLLGKSGDVFIGARSDMGETKLSLHRSGRWRLAHTAASDQRAPDGDRVLFRYDPPDELADGWRRGATVVVAHSCLQPNFPEPLKAKTLVSWWPSPGVGRGLRFDVLLREDDESTGGLTVNGAAGEVGRLQNPGGAGIWVVATDVPSTQKHEQFLDELRSTLRVQASEPLAMMQSPSAMAWGWDHDDKAPVLYDLGDPRAPQPPS